LSHCLEDREPGLWEIIADGGDLAGIRKSNNRGKQNGNEKETKENKQEQKKREKKTNRQGTSKEKVTLKEKQSESERREKSRNEGKDNEHSNETENPNRGPPFHVLLDPKTSIHRSFDPSIARCRLSLSHWGCFISSLLMANHARSRPKWRPRLCRPKSLKVAFIGAVDTHSRVPEVFGHASTVGAVFKCFLIGDNAASASSHPENELAGRFSQKPPTFEI
jgi:hypothetical protein